MFVVMFMIRVKENMSNSKSRGKVDRYLSARGFGFIIDDNSF